MGKQLKLVFLSMVLAIGMTGGFVVFDSVNKSFFAEAAMNDCTSGKVCTWINNNYGGPMYYYTGPMNICFNIGPPYKNAISSAYNRTTVMVNFYPGEGCGGWFGQWGLDAYCGGCVYDHASWSWPNIQNDNAESMYIGNNPP